MLAFTYYKLHCLIIIGLDLPLQQTIYKVMTDEIRATLESFSKKINQLADLEITSKETDFFRCCFFDPQGWSDIATVIICSNYSIIMTVLERLC